MTDRQEPTSIPTSANDVAHDFDANASPPPGSQPARRSLLARTGNDHADPGHLAEDDEWATIVAHAHTVQRGEQP